MKDRVSLSFWMGFLLAAAVVGWLYWIYQRQREVIPPPLAVRRPNAASTPDRYQAARETAPAASQSAEDEAAADPLEELRGIGPATARKLRAGGIRTFAALARQDPESVAKMVGPTSYDPADWIAEAARRSGS
ncbi:MAG: helix-hairpin-helix domain-containing protein [Candidatus Promineifilaceae bacterium]|nr:helix-hairpin-helix domain-containing protein [Candidatus Promineifilaceae bacterium]